MSAMHDFGIRIHAKVTNMQGAINKRRGGINRTKGIFQQMSSRIEEMMLDIKNHFSRRQVVHHW